MQKNNKKFNDKSFVGMSAKAVLKIAMLLAIIVALMGVMNPIEVKAQSIPLCPQKGAADCENYSLSTKTIEYPEGSGCFLYFTYCHRNNCEGELEIFLLVYYIMFPLMVLVHHLQLPKNYIWRAWMQ